jgi:hypothetical protein
MNREDAVRRIRALRKVTLENGALPPEVDNAGRLLQRIAERFAIEPEERQAQPHPMHSSAAWDYWCWLLSEFHVEGRRFCNRASGMMGPDRLIVIKLDTSEWQVQRVTPRGYQAIVKHRGLESLRVYLRENAPHRHSFA